MIASADPNSPSSTIVRFRKRWNGWSVVKPIPASTCWQWRATVCAVRPAIALASAAVVAFGSSPAAPQRRVERLDRDERVGEPVPHGLERRDRAPELHALDRVGAREGEHRAASRPRSGARPRAGRARRPRPTRAASSADSVPAPRSIVTRVDAGGGIDAGRGMRVDRGARNGDRDDVRSRRW